MTFSLPTIVRRRVNIDFDSARSAGWHLGNKGVEDVLNALSYVFPPGERYFIESVQHYRDRITDPVLQDQVKRFLYQEAMHSKEHARSNDVITLTHPYGPKFEKFAEWLLGNSKKLTPKITHLAVTTALEHFTAMLADGLLMRQDWIIENSDPAFASLWLWHAVEETEHKAVAFDVYQSVAGKGLLSYLHRVWVMATVSMLFMMAMAVGFRLIRKTNAAAARRAGQAPPPQPVPRRPKETPPAGTMLPHDPRPWKTPSVRLLVKDISLKLYFDYYRPSFHPWNHDNRALIDEWKKRYRDFGSGPDVEREVTA